ncbi:MULTISPECIES: NAD(P) transhydrogenase subunit alpha [Acidiphilium]|jgi:NAD(P) transhydrogenase subunit alpha|uniref:proton-translocating NAD(P)(+) transhydrogenase n=2 Tax=Acidiphilium TaxID=522 RepID=A5G0H3_ACICJ|nr:MULTISPECIES: NAD(P) transhydrogenase subunit alpha [Acidiphilium]ABQ31355.1 NAD/NADP transhydrogenase alpha subunit-like protein [Acidiphilium cryptum JF-5]EGO96630.1 NAD/NADP transhydrogenase alpha subunit-like protein [Acidiphilium sp. PM]MBS3024118.1 NAD(P) transhydrogenase subunit alpha [Acidiphilium multivorum]BAJ81748.1 NAD(P) transhydrogenase alpha subunit 2 [Acidiphilium multivorum AIU301]GAN74558.1 NAD/NADP transhydrogenase subunit alpha [Acidiphilium multivorum AIU301]
MTPAQLADQADALAHKATVLAQNAAGFAAQAAAHAPHGAPLIDLFAIFVMAVFVGYYVIWSVTPALHSPLLAVTNAISSVIIVGAMLATGLKGGYAAHAFGFIAVLLASVNIVGGFLVTQRMLAMFKKKAK